MTTVTDVPFDPTPHLEARNQVVNDLIHRTAVKHAALDAATDAAAGLVPFGTGVAMAGQVYAQVNHLYPKMIREIGLVYTADPDDYTRNVTLKATGAEFVANALILATESGLLDEAAGQIGGLLFAEFGQDFLLDLIREAMGESAGGLALAQVPFIGVPAGAAVAGLLAWKLTWRVGLTVSSYFQNGQAFVGGSRKATTRMVKTQFVKGKVPTDMSAATSRLRHEVPEVRATQSAKVARRVETYRSQGLDDTAIRAVLQADGCPNDLIAGALRA